MQIIVFFDIRIYGVLSADKIKALRDILKEIQLLKTDRRGQDDSQVIAFDYLISADIWANWLVKYLHWNLRFSNLFSKCQAQVVDNISWAR